jgi:hypothetical protein
VNRHVPIIIGVVCLSAAVAMVIWTLWLSVPAAFLLWFGWVSLKTGVVASDEEIAELTGERTISEASARRFRDRL